MAKAKEPWFRKTGEPSDAWEAFQNYRNQRPPRRAISMSRDGSKLDVTKVAYWFKKFRWDARVAAWDNYCADMFATHEAAEQLQVLAEARDLASGEISKMLKLSRDSDKPIARVYEINSLLDKVVKLSKLMRGEATPETEDDLSMDNLDEDSLAAIREILHKND